MANPANPPGYNADAFSPAPGYRETSISELVDAMDGPEPQAVLAYPFRRPHGMKFIELQPYDEE